MNFYDLAMTPIENLYLKKIRQTIIPKANGSVLEIGVGTGANLNFYKQENITQLYGIEPSFTKETLEKTKDQMILIKGVAEDLPFEDQFFDTVVCTIALCSVDSLEKSLDEIHRVLKDKGAFFFVEHVLPENTPLKNILQKVNPSWHAKTHCNLAQATDKMLIKHKLMCNHTNKRNFKIFAYGRAIKL